MCAVYLAPEPATDFCGSDGPAHGGGEVVIRSRYQQPGDTELVLPK